MEMKHRLPYPSGPLFTIDRIRAIEYTPPP